MVKATLTLPNGTIVTIEGSVEEVQTLFRFYGEVDNNLDGEKQKLFEVDNTFDIGEISKKTKPDDNDLIKMSTLAKTCSEADVIEKSILDKQNEANRVLLPLYLVHEYLSNPYGLTTSEISKVTIELGTKVSRQNVLRALKFSANGFTQKQGNPPRYTINRRGISHIKSVLAGKVDLEGGNPPIPATLTPKKRKKQSRSMATKKSPTGFVTQLKESGFFSDKKSLSDVQKRLEEMGQIVPLTSLSSTLLNLIRGNQLKRVKDNNKWFYYVE
jgi:hypothetical protein